VVNAGYAAFEKRAGRPVVNCLFGKPDLQAAIKKPGGI
jgi:hypothetical protein